MIPQAMTNVKRERGKRGRTKVKGASGEDESVALKLCAVAEE
jgi:hypothetical protein